MESELSVAAVSAGYRRLAGQGLPLLALAALALTVIPLSTSLPLALTWLAVALPLLLALQAWQARRDAVLPVLPLVALMQALTFALPLFTQAERLSDPFTQSLLGPAALSLLLWFLAIWGGWAVTPRSWCQWPPQRPLALGGGGLQAQLPHLLLLLALGVDLLVSSGLFFQLLGPLAGRLLNPVRVVAGLASTLGIFLGALRWSHRRLPAAPLWWALVVVLIWLPITSFLLSAAQGRVLALLLGVWLGRARQALPITLALLLVFGTLNQGKFVMRGRYDGTGVSPPSNPIVLAGEWIGASLEQIEAGRGQGLASDRINTLQNLLFVEGALRSGIPTFNGGSLAVIPQVLVPRVLATDKVRSQEGQVLLNLHFGRQLTREQTETTYIAWGFLAEAVGNFGRLWGPLLVGAVLGMLIRLTENLGRHQLLLAPAGLLSLLLLVLWIASYEMVASTFVAAAFQLIVLVLVAAYVFAPGRR